MNCVCIYLAGMHRVVSSDRVRSVLGLSGLAHLAAHFLLFVVGCLDCNHVRSDDRCWSGLSVSGWVAPKHALQAFLCLCLWHQLTNRFRAGVYTVRCMRLLFIHASEGDAAY